MTVEFQGEGKYESQWDAWDDGFTVQAELISALHADIERLREALDKIVTILKPSLL